MKITWTNKGEKNEVYRDAIRYCDFYNLTKTNSSVLTLLLPPGNFSNVEEVQQYLSILLQEFQTPSILSIEPVIPGNQMNSMSLLKIYGRYNTELLPFYHAHVLILDEELHKGKLTAAWNKIVGSKMNQLVQCNYLESSIREIINYITKFFERKRGLCGIIGFVHFDDTNSTNETEENQTNSGAFLQKVKKTLNAFFRMSFQLPLALVGQTEEKIPSCKKSSRSP